MPEPTETLADWKAKTGAATPGPWVFSFAGHDDYEPGLYPQVLKMDNGDTIIELDAGSREVNEASSSFRYDADFIAVSRTAMPKLLAAVESVLALHKPETRYTAAGWEEFSFESRADAAEYGDVQEFKVCHECGQIETHDGGEDRCYEYSIWPCATVRAIESALGGT